MPLSSSLLRRSAIATATLALGFALVAGVGVTSASAAGSVTKIAILYSGNIYAGMTKSFSIVGEDAAGNIVSDESATTVLAVDNGGSVSGKTVTFAAPGNYTLTATDTGGANGDFTATQVIAVPPGPTTEIRTTPATSQVATGNTVVFTTQSYDAKGYLRGIPTVTYTSSVSSDLIHGSSITFKAYGTHTITAKSSSFTSTATVVVAKTLKPTLRFSGSFVTRHTVKAVFSGVSGIGAHVTYQWYVAGVAVSGATRSSFLIPTSALRHTVKLVFSITAPGYFDYTHTTSSYKVVK